MISLLDVKVAETFYVQIRETVMLMHVANQIVFVVLVHQMVRIGLVFFDFTRIVAARNQIAINVIGAVTESNYSFVFDGIVEHFDIVEKLGVVILWRSELPQTAQLARLARERIDFGDKVAQIFAVRP
mgnify:FL=1